MPFSHHSHSGQFCEGHAVDKLEDIVLECIRQRMGVLALTEHMPRDMHEDLYPEEIEVGTTTESLEDIFDKYHAEARRLQIKYAETIVLLVGLEIDWIRPESRKYIEYLLGKHQFDTFIGSVHHVHGVPIDYSREMYQRALAISRGNAQKAGLPATAEEMLFSDYYDAQLAMLEALKPPIIGHFDLIRLLSDDPNGSSKTYSRVWRKILRNLLYVKEYGGVLEINSAGVRKGLIEPYPQREIVERFNEMGGKFCLSDDSHGLSQIGWGYKKLVSWIETCGVKTVTIFIPSKTTKDHRFPRIDGVEIWMEQLHPHDFFKVQDSRSSAGWPLTVMARGTNGGTSPQQILQSTTIASHSAQTNPTTPP